MKINSKCFLVKIFFLTLPLFFLSHFSGMAQQTAEPAQAPAVSGGDSKSVGKVTVDPAANTQISLDFKDADMGTVLRVISLKSGVNIVAGPEVVGTVTIRLQDVDWEKALDVILRTYNYVYERTGNVIRITTRDKMQQEPVDTKTFILNYSKAAEIQASIQDILTERGRVKVAERMNMIVVTDIPTNIFHISQVIASLDKMTPQAYIDSKIIRTSNGATENMGINWNLQANASGAARPTSFPFPYRSESDGQLLQQFYPTNTALAPSTSNPTNFPSISAAAPAGSTGYSLGTLSFSSLTAAISMIKSDSRTKIVSNPRIVVLNNQTAKVQVGDQVPIPKYEINATTGSAVVNGFDYKDIGVVLNVTPHINDANQILVDLKPEVTTDAGALTIGTGIVAEKFSTTKAETQVLIHSGETIAIGGLLTDNSTVSESKVPYLSDIPLIGKILFKSKTQTETGGNNTVVETLFFVTVTSVDSHGQPVSASNRKDDDLSSQSQSSTSGKKAASENAVSVVADKKSAA